MEINVIEEEKKKLIFEIKGEGHTLSNLLEKELWKDEDVKAAGYNVAHPLIGIPRMIVETNGKKTAREAVEDAVKRVKKQNADFQKAFKK
jgi:DNA-directed RNA polymerase subunit L